MRCSSIGTAGSVCTLKRLKSTAAADRVVPIGVDRQVGEAVEQLGTELLELRQLRRRPRLVRGDLHRTWLAAPLVDVGTGGELHDHVGILDVDDPLRCDRDPPERRSADVETTPFEFVDQAEPLGTE